jgi:hypothetical protein
MALADFLTLHAVRISPGLSAFFPPMPAVSTQRAITFRYSGHYNDVFSHPAHYASYTVPVRQDRPPAGGSLPSDLQLPATPFPPAGG